MTPLRISDFRKLGRPLLLGHRGSRSGAPENTLRAIERAAAGGADGVEIDVRLCATGQVVVVHDPDLARITAGRDRRLVASLSLAELTAVRLGPGLDTGVPRLEDVLALCRQRGLCLNVELKRDVPDRRALTAAVAGLLKHHDVTHAVVVSSFDPLMLAHFRWRAPFVPVALLLHRPRNASARYRPPPAVGVHAVHVQCPLVTQPRVRRWHRRGLRVHVWTVNEPAVLVEHIRLGVDGFITDRPELLQPHLAAATRY